MLERPKYIQHIQITENGEQEQQSWVAKELDNEKDLRDWTDTFIKKKNKTDKVKAEQKQEKSNVEEIMNQHRLSLNKSKEKDVFAQ